MGKHLVFWAKTVLFGRNTVVFCEITIVFWSNTVTLWGNTVSFQTNKVVFEANTLVICHWSLLSCQRSSVIVIGQCQLWWQRSVTVCLSDGNLRCERWMTPLKIVLASGRNCRWSHSLTWQIYILPPKEERLKT